MSAKVGLIAEDLSDIEVVKILARRVSGKSISTAHFIGKGCGPLKRKTPAWCKSLLTKGCNSVMLIHDRDRNSAATLRMLLEGILSSAPQTKKVVVIPEEELEAWLLSDITAVNNVMRLTKGIKAVHHPERINSPKEYLRDSVLANSVRKTHYVNTIHNRLIAEQVDLGMLRTKCPSFGEFYSFFAPQKKSK